ncbi:EamA family transporter [Actinoallomurus iriomotensis]|uniref:EamA family transporter n=1 Tax=Actinoallomurus iriomotensis TaxID=478107 RepID=UPI002552C45F|nr:EamA family transporter [Actinoallomurus iriomotensis]
MGARRPPGVPAPVLVLGSVIAVQTGQSLGKGMFGQVGAPGVITLRLALAALILCALWRPRPPRREALPLIAALGAAIAGMQFIYPAMERLPVGIASTVQFLGPLVLALAGSRRPADVLWAGLAAVGVAMIYRPGGGPVPFPPAGVALALTSGAFMAAYLVLNKRAGARRADGSDLTWAVVFAALLVLPLGPAFEGLALFRGDVLLAGAGTALVSAVIPWSLDQAALRRLPERVVAVMVSLEPAAGAVSGLLVLGEHLSPPQWLAIACVSVASGGVVVTARARGERTPAAPT